MDEKSLNQPVDVALFYKCGGSSDWMPEKLTEAISWLQKFLDQVPDEYRDVVTIEIDVDEYSPDICISYRRPPTEAEKQSRLDKEQQQIDETRTYRRQEYERLKAEFGE